MSDVDEPQFEERLSGGGMNSVSRVGDTVRRKAGKHTRRTAKLLDHLESVGFYGAPRHWGTAPDGREVVEYVPGTVGNYPLTSEVRSATALTSSARLLRRYHDATVEVATRWLDGWMLPSHDPAEVVCHGDFAPYNCVFRDGEAVGIIDFDTAHPGPRVRDIAYAVYRFAPLTHPDNVDGFGTSEEQLQRAKLFCDNYGMFDRSGLVEVIAARLVELVDFMRRQAAGGNAAFASNLAHGHDQLYLRDVGYVESLAGPLREALST